MGRKIPAKKHRGVKDPLVQQANRLQSLKGKIDAPPKDPDDQPVPRSLIRLFGLQEQIKKDGTKIKYNAKSRQNMSHVKDNGVKPSGDNPISRLRKLPGESGRGFSLRINSAIKALHTAEEHLDYPLDLEAEDYKGQRMAEQRERRAKKRRRAQRAGEGRGEGRGEGARLSKTQKLALKKKAKQQKTLEARLDAGPQYERVPFGAVAHAPPALAPRGAPRAGRRGLLLAPLLAGPGGAGGGAGGGPGGAAGALRRELARRDAVAAYRALKANKHKGNAL